MERRGRLVSAGAASVQMAELVHVGQELAGGVRAEPAGQKLVAQLELLVAMEAQVGAAVQK